jgi:outer membrane protein assembly factor BamE (lipoprotein component of BamABCDE complex)
VTSEWVAASPVAVRVSRSVRVSLVFLALIVAVSCAPQTAIGVNPVAIRQVKVGMTKQQVTAILGEPLRVRAWSPDDAIFDYAIPGWRGPGLWVHFNKDSVTTVQASQHFVFEDAKPIYEEAAHHPTFETEEFESMFSSRR